MCVNSHGSKDFADAIKLKILRRRDYPGPYNLLQCNHEDPYKREEESERKK